MRIPPLTTVVALVLAFLLLECGTGSPRFVSKTPAVPDMGDTSPELEGIASYYADEFDGRQTANGEVYDMNGLTAAHRSLPFGTRIRVTNLVNGKSVDVRVNDRGPFVENRMLDLSLGAAKVIGLIADGTAPVRIEILELGQDRK